MKRLLIVFALLLSMPCYSGSLEIHDEDNVLSSHFSIDSSTQVAPFNVRVLISSKRGHGPVFDSYVAHAAGNGLAVIGVDPIGHHTQISVGSDVGISSSLLSNISSLGNSDFKFARWDDGISKIINALTTEKRAMSAPLPMPVYKPVQVAPVVTPTPDTQPFDWWLWGWLAVSMCIFVFGFIWIRHRVKVKAEEEARRLRALKQAWAKENTEEYYQTHDRPITRRTAAYDADEVFRYTQPATRTVINETHVVNPGSSILDYAIADSIINHHHNDPIPVPAYAVVPTSSPAPVSLGGSDWGSSSSSDSGGSSFDSGSSFDFGGGSSSGGSDW